MGTGLEWVIENVDRKGVSVVGSGHNRRTMQLMERSGVKMCGMGNDGAAETLIGLERLRGGGHLAMAVPLLASMPRRGKALQVKAGVQIEGTGFEAEEPREVVQQQWVGCSMKRGVPQIGSPGPGILLPTGPEVVVMMGGSEYTTRSCDCPQMLAVDWWGVPSLDKIQKITRLGAASNLGELASAISGQALLL